MKKTRFFGIMFLTVMMFSFSNATISVDQFTSNEQSQTDPLTNDGNNDCTPTRAEYDNSFTIPGPFPFLFNLVCIDEQLMLDEINIHSTGKYVVSASCHTNDKGVQVESSYFVGSVSGDTYHLAVTSEYHVNYNFQFVGGVFSQQGAYVSRSNVSGEITNETTGEVIPVTISSKFVANANGNPTVEQYELSCE